MAVAGSDFLINILPSVLEDTDEMLQNSGVPTFKTSARSGKRGLQCAEVSLR